MYGASFNSNRCSKFSKSLLYFYYQKKRKAWTPDFFSFSFSIIKENLILDSRKQIIDDQNYFSKSLLRFYYQKKGKVWTPDSFSFSIIEKNLFLDSRKQMYSVSSSSIAVVRNQSSKSFAPFLSKKREKPSLIFSFSLSLSIIEENLSLDSRKQIIDDRNYISKRFLLSKKSGRLILSL